MEKLDLDGAGEILARRLAQERPGARDLRVMRLAIDFAEMTAATISHQQ